MEKLQKKGFIMGLVTGLVVVALLGGVYYLGQMSAGGSGSKVAQAPTNNQPTDPTGNQPTQPQPDASKLQPVGKDDHIRGNVKAKVTMIEYSDFECPFCQRFHETVQQVLKDYKDTVRVVYRHFPLRSIHPNAQKAAEASECASVQGKFWEMHDKLFELSAAKNFNIDAFKKAAADLKLDTNKFNACLDNGEMANRVEKDYQDGIAGGVTGTPASFINGQLIAGAYPLADVKSIIDAALK